MTERPLPLFFPEALRDTKTLSPRVRAMGFTLADLTWLRNVELATHALRSAQTSPMIVENILLNVAGSDAEPLAGSFMMHSVPNGTQAILYTPYGGLVKFDDQQALLKALDDTLKDAEARKDLLSFLPISQRDSLTIDTPFRLTGRVIDGPVFEDQSSLVKQCHRKNIEVMLQQLSELPTLTTMLNQLLNTVLSKTFPGQDQSATRVSYFVESPAVGTSETTTTRRRVDSVTLSDALLRFYLHQTWPSEQVREFSNPQQPSSTNNPTHQQLWEKAVKEIAAGLTPKLASLLQAYWAADFRAGVSRRNFFAQAMSDKARMDLLFKRQDAIISPEQSQALTGLLDRDSAASSTDTSGLRPEKVRLWERRNHFVELAGTLMLNSSSTAYLYTQSNGLQVLKNDTDLKATLRAMATAAGYADELYSLLTLRERDVFLGFDKPDVSGEPILGPVFQGMVDDIITKQQDNITYALDSCRNSDGAFDIQALFDQALDVRGLLDNQLLETVTTQRWRARAANSPSIVLAVQAALSIKKFQSAQSSLDLKTAALPSGSVEQQRTSLEAIKADLAHAMSVGIRGEATLRVLTKTLRADEKAIIDTVLNPDKPTRSQRDKLHGFRPDAWSLMLECSNEPNLIPLANCFLLTERGGLDPSTSGRAILWTPGRGLESFSSIASAKVELDRRLLDNNKRLSLLENLPRTQYRPHRTYTLESFRLIESNVLQDRQQSAIEHYLDARKLTLSLKLPAASVLADVEQHKRAPTPLNLKRATQIAEAIITRQSLPVWLGAAPDSDVQRHIELLEQYRHSVENSEDYLHGIKPLTDYVREQLKTLMTGRFPGVSLDPDQLRVTPNPTSAGAVQTLTDFALNPTHGLQSTGFTLTSKIAQTLPAGLDANEVKRLLQQLDIQTAYRQFLTEKLASDATDVASRQQRFIKQLPWQLLLHAHTLKLQGKLSERSFGLIQQVLDMPDALARAAVSGANAIVRPLELIATEGAAAVKTLGLYLIGESATGPQILYAPYDKHLGLTEYENEAAVLSSINRAGPLRDLVLRRLPDPHKATYENVLASTSNTAIRLASNPIDGNLLHLLFIDNKDLLSHLLGSQSQRSAESDWETLKVLFSKGIKFGIQFLPGKLAIPLMLRDSYTAFKQSAEALQDHHWKTALRTFINGVAQMVSLGKLLREPAASTAEPVVRSEPVVETPFVATDVTKVDVTSPSRTLLQPFEATGVELKKLGAKASDGAYLESTTSHKYAPVDGKVYRIEKSGAASRIVDDQRQGPDLLNSGTQWVLDPEVHTAHFGKAMSLLRNKHQPRDSVRKFINVEARGMEAIHRLYPEKARMILQALDMARFYAFNSLHNLAQLRAATSGTRLDGFLKEFFNVPTIDSAILNKIKATIVPLCEALVDPTLDRLDHQRFIVGSSRYPEDAVIAFVLAADQQQTVHFTELFFKPGLSEYDHALTEPFDVVAHAQAASLIHEFSHLFSGTIDIAYVESRRPFSDLISTFTMQNNLLKLAQEQFQREALSLHTPIDELFAYWNSELNVWQDLDDIPEAKKLRDLINSITGTGSMAEARSVFLDPASAERRIDTILRNADSVARLVCEMGRRLDPVP
ncbi:dermonecrotic toxin domain-containing protein [Pseudomonas sp. 6D_7.1_Bac1]|uniref:dermonecrotic toxin domain-containing protein n=1 Tax=Pseudomonas sp. 6D_7.1_Bac1 TaxID=2971615 RepID=UPI0021C7FDBF|nr:DUF6543 domain-containing protein [Pseudomonas sp. 6D_7.1_Bac1]MCU1747866.1 hypothetical protein [Pseudomonas sp. 6D_7.1_Bac1]